MPVEQNPYEGRKGQKRLKAIEKQIERINEEFDHHYDDSPEMIYLMDEIRWDGISRLIFTMALRDVDFKWKGLRDYGFIRLCRSWLMKCGITVVTEDIVTDMITDILPSGMCSELKDELLSLEIF